MKHTYKKCLSIAGFDGSGGAGMQADLKTFSALGCYGMTILTALPIQNTTGVRTCYPVPLQSIQDQLEAIFDDITPDTIKIGMLFSEEIIELVSAFIREYATNIPIVLDPVMVSKSGDPLIADGAILALKKQLIPLCTVITPNLPEACTLINEPHHRYMRQESDRHNVDKTDNILYDISHKIAGEIELNSLLLKGGHMEGQLSNDLLTIDRDTQHILTAPRIASKNTHGTGCTLSAAICAFLALDFDLYSACKLAKNYVFHAIRAGSQYEIGKGNGPLHHFYDAWPKLDFDKLLDLDLSTN